MSHKDLSMAYIIREVLNTSVSVMVENKRTMIRGIDPLLFERFVNKVKELHDGKRRGKYSYVAAEINDLMRVFVETEGEIVRSTGDKTPIKRHIIADSLKELEKKQERSEHGSFDYANIKKVVRRVCIRHERYDYRTLNNYVKIVADLCEEREDDYGFYTIPPYTQKFTEVPMYR